MPQSPPMSFSNFSFPPPSRQVTERSSDSLSGNVAQPPGSLGFSRDGVGSEFATRLPLETSPPIPSRPEGDIYDPGIADSWIGPYRSDGSPSPSSPSIVHDFKRPLRRRRTSPPGAPNTSPIEHSRAGSKASSASVSPAMSRKSSSAFLRAIGSAVGNAISKKLVRRKTGQSAEDASSEGGFSPERPAQSMSLQSEVLTDPGHGRTYRLDPPPSPLTPRPRESVIPLSPSLGGKHSHHWPAPANTPTRSFASQNRNRDDPAPNKRPESAESTVLGAYWTNGGWVGDGSGSESEEYKADSVDGDSAAHLSPSSVRPVRPMSGSSAETAIYRGESQESRSKDGHSTEDRDGRVVVPELESYSDLVERLRPLFPSPPVHTSQMGSTRKRTREPKKDASLQGGNPADPRS